MKLIIYNKQNLYTYNLKIKIRKIQKIKFLKHLRSQFNIKNHQRMFSHSFCLIKKKKKILIPSFISSAVQMLHFSRKSHSFQP